MKKKNKIAIIGAGLSGLTIARELSFYADVTVFEKSRGIGGRMSTRYADPFYFDHGAQFFTARTSEFKNFLIPYLDSKNIATWNGKIFLQEKKNITEKAWTESYYVGMPNMNSFCKKMAENINVKTNIEIRFLQNGYQEKWKLIDKDENFYEEYDWVISTAPFPQTQNLFKNHTNYFCDNPVKTLSCHALLLGFSNSWHNDWIAREISGLPIVWMGANSSKPSRNKDVTCLVIHTDSKWSGDNIDIDLENAVKILSPYIKDILDIDANQADYTSLHRWLYASTENKTNLFFNNSLKLAATGDWSSHPRIEDVWISAKNLSSQIKQFLKE